MHQQCFRRWLLWCVCVLFWFLFISILTYLITEWINEPISWFAEEIHGGLSTVCRKHGEWKVQCCVPWGNVWCMTQHCCARPRQPRPCVYLPIQFHSFHFCCSCSCCFLAGWSTVGSVTLRSSSSSDPCSCRYCTRSYMLVHAGTCCSCRYMLLLCWCCTC